jgi:hypothetical protein
MKLPIELVPDHVGWLSICAWCYPGQSFFERFPEVRGKLTISHSICDDHHRQFEQQMVRVHTIPNTVNLPPPPKQPLVFELGAL